MKAHRLHVLIAVTALFLFIISLSAQTLIDRDHIKATVIQVFDQGLAMAKTQYTNEQSQQQYAAGFLGGFLRGLVYADFPKEEAVFPKDVTIHDFGWTAGFQTVSSGTVAALKDISLSDFGYELIRTNGIVHLESCEGKFMPSQCDERWRLYGNHDFFRKAHSSNDNITCDFNVDLAGYRSPDLSSEGSTSIEFVVRETFSLEVITMPQPAAPGYSAPGIGLGE